MNRYTFLIRIAFVLLISIILWYLSEHCNMSVIPMPKNKIVDYHMQILTISSVFCGFSLTNLTLLLEVHSESIMEKLQGTDILQKRNKSISYSIIYGAISAFISVFWVLRVNINLIELHFGKGVVNLLQGVSFYLEIVSLLLCILYFLISSKKMIELVSIINEPQTKMTADEVQAFKDRTYQK